LSIQNFPEIWIVKFFANLPDGWEKCFFTTFNPDGRDERGLGKF
jgi:hypothetical protein